MRIVNPSIELIDGFKYTSLLKKIERIGRVCYKSEDKITDDSAEQFIRGIIKRGHESVIEHASLSVKVICDRGVTHEIVRHRLASYSQESTRYCNYSKEEFGMEMLDQWAVHLGCEDEVERQKRYKLKRLEQRVEKAKLESNLRVNEPLTLEEMQNMMGEPVWIVDRHGNGNWEIVSKGILSIYNGYKAYRSKPDHFRDLKKMVEVQGDG